MLPELSSGCRLALHFKADLRTDNQIVMMFMNPYRIPALLLSALPVLGCTTTSDLSLKTQPCTSEWYQQVEKQITTGDGLGHGPDPGSAEWRSVIEFRMGIRGDAEVPDRNSDDWCQYIDQKINL